jgi:hypothetical protein
VVLESVVESIKQFALSGHERIEQMIFRLTNQQFVYFTKSDDLSVLNRVMIYVTENEITKKLKIVSVEKDEDRVSKEFLEDLQVLDRIYPQLDIEFIQLKGTFGPELIRQLSKEWKIPVNFMFISSPGDKFPYKVSELGGVRVII